MLSQGQGANAYGRQLQQAFGQDMSQASQVPSLPFSQPDVPPSQHPHATGDPCMEVNLDEHDFAEEISQFDAFIAQ
eukprot:9238516-Karenia_brevis.AAC.1